MGRPRSAKTTALKRHFYEAFYDILTVANRPLDWSLNTPDTNDNFGILPYRKTGRSRPVGQNDSTKTAF